MVYNLKCFFHVITLFMGTSSFVLCAEKPQISVQFPALLKMHAQTDLTISPSTFEKFDTNKKILYLGMQCIDFEQNGVTKQSVIDYVSFLRILFPHLKTDMTVWNNLANRYGKSKKDIVAIEAAHLFLKPEEKKTYEELEKELTFARGLEQKAFKEINPHNKLKLYQDSLNIWERIHRDSDYSNEPSFQSLHYQSIGKRLDLKRLIRVAKKQTTA